MKSQPNKNEFVTRLWVYSEYLCNPDRLFGLSKVIRHIVCPPWWQPRIEGEVTESAEIAKVIAFAS